MSFVTCYDAVSMVLDDAAERFGQAWRIDNDALKRLKNDCRDLDAIVREFNCDSVEAEVDEETMDLMVSLFCEEMTLENGRSNSFFKVIQHCSSFGFRNAGEDCLQIFFRYRGLFARV